jgi:hypothetical protein
MRRAVDRPSGPSRSWIYGIYCVKYNVAHALPPRYRE